MIIFENLKYKNLLSTGNVFTEIDLNKNKTTLIIGENGAGKSTILEAISYALYGKALRNINKPQLINSINQKQLLVELSFSISNKSYLVRRGQKPAVFEIYCDGKLLNQDSQSRDYQEILEKQILKLNHKSFSQIITLSIANYIPFMKLPAASRREVIEDLLDIQIFSVMNTLLKEKIGANKAAIQTAEYDIKLIQSKIDMHKKHMAEINQNSKELIKTRKNQIKEYIKENDKHLKRSSNIKTLLEQAYKKLEPQDALKNEYDEIKSKIKKANDIAIRIASEIDFYSTNTSCPTCKQELEESFKTNELAKKRSLVNKANESIPKLEKKLQIISAKLEELKLVDEKISELNNEYSGLNVQINTNLRFIQSVEQDVIDLEEKMIKTKEDNSTEKLLTNELNIAMQHKEVYIKDREVLSMASQLLKDGGIKTRIIKQYVPIMNKLINKYLAHMDLFVQFELDETFKETIKSRFRDDFTYDSFSQGEKLRIDLALLFTFRAIAKIRNSSSTNLLFFDEILDSSLDIGGVEEFLKIIGNLLTDTNVFIISHRGDQMIDKFEHVIKFERVRNFSRVA